MPTEWSPNKNSGHRGSVGFPGQQCSTHIVIYRCQGSYTAHDSVETGQLEALHWEIFWTLSFVLLALADFNLYPSTLINHNHECNSFQSILEVLLVN